MSRELRRALLALREQQKTRGSEAQKASGLVFPSRVGTAIEMNNRVFKPLVASADLRPMRFHDLRHTFGSLLLQAGASLAYVRDQMGHASIQITADVYGLDSGSQYGKWEVDMDSISFVDRLDGPTCPLQSATPPQQNSMGEFREIAQVLQNVWLGGRDSNPDTQIQSLQSYR